MPTLTFSLAEWCDLHSKDGPCVIDPEARIELYPDGASRGDLDARCEPPTEPGALLRTKRRYVEVRLAGEEHAFKAFQTDCTWQIKYNMHGTAPSPPADAVQQLERGAERIRKLRDELAALDLEISRLPDEVARRAYLESQRQRQGVLRDRMNEILGVKI